MDDKPGVARRHAPGIARNAFGLRGSVSYLIETRGVGIGLQNFQRRVATHYLLAKAVLEVGAADRGQICAGPQWPRARRGGRRSIRGRFIITHEAGERESTCR